MQLVGQQIGRYKIRSAIGVGGMGEVFLAQDTQLRRSVALKFLPAAYLNDKDRLQRFEREAHAIAALNHPNIAHIYEVGEADGLRFISMEYVEGITLGDAIRGNTSLAKLLKYLTQVANALSKAHESGIVHRDLKPDNIMIARDGYAKILDFGLAKLVRPAGHGMEKPGLEEMATIELEQQSLPGMILGTPGYMSPEQARGKTNELDHRSDIFSFGCILYEAVSGHKAFEGEDLIDSLHKILHSNPPSLSQFKPALPAELQRIVRRCLAKDPDKRYQSIKDVAIELEEVRETDQLERSYSSGDLPRKAKTDLLAIGEGSPKSGPHSVAVTSAASRAPGLKFKQLIIGGGLLLLAAGLIAGAYTVYRWNQGLSARHPLRIVPLTNSPYPERNPSLSPDGRQIAYVWAGEKNDNFDVYVKIIDAGLPLRLTTDAAKDMSPVWSPDARHIAFMRGTGDNKGFYVIPALGGPERKLSDAFGYSGLGVFPQALDWSSDGKFLAVTDKGSRDEPWSIFLISVESGEKHRITTPPPQTHGDIFPAFSADGKTLAFGRMNATTGDVGLVSVDGGEPKFLTSNYRLPLRGLDWTSDGNSLIFTAGSTGMANLWIMPAEGGEPELVPGGGENIGELSVSRVGDQLAYAQYTMDTNLWRTAVPETSATSVKRSDAHQLIPSTRLEETPRYSPDGKKIAFTSNSSGNWQIWISDSDGRSLTQLTHLDKAVPASPRWSPDGGYLVFELRESGNTDICIINSGGGTPQRLTNQSFDDSTPSFSRDGKFVYFSSNRNGRNQVWKMPAGGGEAVQITKHGGSGSSESLDGRLLYYMKDPDESAAFVNNNSPLWVVDSNGGEESPVLTHRVGRRWDIAKTGIYFLVAAADQTSYSINFFDFDTRASNKIGIIEGKDRAFHISSLTVSPDGAWLVYSQRDQLDYDIKLVENFR